MKKEPPRSRRRHLSKEDEALWEHTAASLDPLKVRKGRHLEAMPDLDAVMPFKPRGKPSEPTKVARAEKPAPPKPASRPAPPALGAFDRKAARRLRQGQIDIEARIDLHGMRQSEAHGALRGFLLAAAGRGLKWVLVITGKGGPRRRGDDEPVLFGGHERGVLRRSVPMWLAEPELRAVVVSFTTAAIPHGGEGALYIELRKPGRQR